METQFSGNPKPFGIIGLVIAIFSLLFSIIPCIGFYAIIPAFIAFVFCTIAFLYSRQQKQNGSVPLAGMIIAVITISIGIFQYVNYKSVFEAKDEINAITNEAFETITKEALDNALEKDSLKNDSIQKSKADSLQF